MQGYSCFSLQILWFYKMPGVCQSQHSWINLNLNSKNGQIHLSISNIWMTSILAFCTLQNPRFLLFHTVKVCFGWANRTDRLWVLVCRKLQLFQCINVAVASNNTIVKGEMPSNHDNQEACLRIHLPLNFKLEPDFVKVETLCCRQLSEVATSKITTLPLPFFSQKLSINRCPRNCQLYCGMEKQISIFGWILG